MEVVIPGQNMHQPVLYQEIIKTLQPHPGGFYVDGTLGLGGHAWGILETSSPDGHLLGLDVDTQALEIARNKLSTFGDRVIIRKASYTMLTDLLDQLDWHLVDGVLLDLGVSSLQLDAPERGFSFLSDAPLDMRFDPQAALTAADLVNQLSEVDLANLIYRYGEERYSRQISRAIIQARPIQTTRELADVVVQAVGSRYASAHLHPATRTFQALRIEVNGELEAIETVLPQAIKVLQPGGRLAVISFHSLEDRLIKTFFRQESRDCICPPRQPVCNCGHRASIREVTRHPIRPDESEVSANPRSRSARLRVAEKLPE